LASAPSEAATVSPRPAVGSLVARLIGLGLIAGCAAPAAGITASAPAEGHAVGARSADLAVPRRDSASVLLATSPAPGLTFHFQPAYRLLALQLATAARRFPQFPGLPPLPGAGGPVDVYLASDEAGFDSLAGGAPPGWGAGVTLPAQNRIVLPAYTSRRGGPQELARTLHHELAHALLHRYLAPARIPHWFDEGYAQYAAGDFDAAAAWQLRVAFALHHAPPLDSLSLDWPADEAHARLAYMLSATAIQYLMEQSGPDGMRAFLEAWRRGGSMEAALRSTYGVTMGQLEEDWSRFVRHRYGWSYLLSQAVIFWFFAAAVLILLRFRRRRADRARLARLKESEPPDQPAYWLEED
jgi:Peptidase MA superfamily